MKRSIVAVVAVSGLIGLAFYAKWPKQPQPTPTEPASEAVSGQTMEDRQPAGVQAARKRGSSEVPENAAIPSTASTASEISPKPNVAASIGLNQAVDILVYRHSTYEQKQAAWKQLRESGRLDQAISDLEQRAANDPRTAEYPATLGQAYLQKCGTIQDVREQGILAMQADKVFDAALNLDPANWEARFTKAVALSYWPATMNKGQEVIDHFQTLIQQQETQAPQPQFAETYQWLGDQYQKAGRGDEARTAWSRGAALFPDHQGLKTRLTAQ